ncbi:hypothetical protein CK203_017472 [Vitis vinifera]|uniref:Uncharacterized protein n=1 Tax=Vitis vinifera TaxID=29760 RepID=A0A438IY16_VITVI|nr:hypothetical protein CK203_017472 [Vitis vinifera]
MSATSSFSVSTPTYMTHLIRRSRSRSGGAVVFNAISSLRKSHCLRPQSMTDVFFRYPYGATKRTRFSPVPDPFPLSWSGRTARNFISISEAFSYFVLVRTEIDVPISVAYNCYSDRESFPVGCPSFHLLRNLLGKSPLKENPSFIFKSIPVLYNIDQANDGWRENADAKLIDLHVLEDKPDLSKWSLKYEAFGRDIEFSWLARNMQPIPNQKIHWRSLEGLPNRGAVRFYPKSPSSCTVEVSLH